jgi:hypothetical protein
VSHPSANVPSVFVSYSRADWNKVQAITHELRGFGVHPWVDFLEIRPGDQWQDTIHRALDAAAALIICLSPLALESYRIPDEIRAAQARGKKVIPVVVEPVEMSALPPSILEIQMLRLSDYPVRRAANEVARAIADVVCKGHAPASGNPAAEVLSIVLGGEGKGSDSSDVVRLARPTASDSKALLEHMQRHSRASLRVEGNVPPQEVAFVFGLLTGYFGPDRVEFVNDKDLTDDSQPPQSYFHN